VPTIVAGAVMPDACPSDLRAGTIPVGGVVAAKDAIHPGMHSADICCSMAVSIFRPGADPTAILDAGMKMSHFGGGGRSQDAQIRPSFEGLDAFETNPMLAGLGRDVVEHFATQGDGNHFFYVGRVASSGAVALVTHHGSRKPGAMLYKRGVAIADGYRRKLSPETAEHDAWIPASTKDGENYWQALQAVRAWTKASHFAIHDRVAEAIGLAIDDRFWNEHNFVFQRSDGLFYHAKGATPAYAGFSADTNGLTLIPLNMAEPILIARGLDAENGLGFAPHGAGRNMSRTAYLKRHAGKTEAEMIAEQAPGIDVRYFCGIPDLSELPQAYKNAASVRAQINKFGLAEVVDTIEPIGNIMAGDWQRDAPWRRKRERPIATT
jgi:RNA-splicing ligase RtcB